MFNKLVIAAIALGVTVGLVMPGADEPAAPQTAGHAAVLDAVDTVLERRRDGHFYVDAMVNGQLVHFVVDTGASSVVLTSKDARHIGLDFKPSEFEVIGRGASGDVRGKRVTLNHVAIGQKEAFDVRAAIADEGLDVSLLGQSYLSRIGSVSIANDRMTLR